MQRRAWKLRMPFDLASAARALRARHGDAMGFRQVLLDHLFAAGCGVREQAVALAFGDALCVRTSGAAQATGKPLCVLALDLDPPGSTRDPRQPQPHWPPHLASLGGPDVAIGWLATLRSLLSTDPQRPWQLIYVRGPALGLADYVGSLQEEVPDGAQIVQIVPSLAMANPLTSLDFLRLDVARAVNVWHFAACDYTYALTAEVRDGDGLGCLQRLLADLGANAWTLHDLQLQPGEPQRLAATLRSAQPVAHSAPGVALVEADAAQRLMFPVNDALAALHALAPALAQPWQPALQRPLHAAALADGLCLHAVVPPGLDADALPQDGKSLSFSWCLEPLARPALLEERGLATGADDHAGPIPAGVHGAQVWRLPLLTGEGELGGLSRALLKALI